MDEFQREIQIFREQMMADCDHEGHNFRSFKMISEPGALHCQQHPEEGL